MSMDIKTFSEMWLRDFARPSNSTNKRYENGIKGFVREFGATDICKITRMQAISWANQNPRSNVRVVQNMFSDAYNGGYIGSNPFANLRLPSSRGRRDIEIPSPGDIDHLIWLSQSIHGQDYGVHFGNLIKFAAYSGLRLSELLALRHSDIDRLNGEIHVNQHIDDFNSLKVGGKGGLRRTVVLLPEADAAMDERSSEYLFVSKRGKRLSKPYHYNIWKRIQVNHRTEIQFHTLRHFTATHLLNIGATPEIAAMQLGHIDAGGRPNTILIQTLYGHPDLENQRRRLKELVNGSDKNTGRQQEAAQTS